MASVASFLAVTLSFLASLQLSVQEEFVVIGWGECPVLVGQYPFDLDRYLGLWYEYERFPNFYQLDLDCVTAEYRLAGENNVTVDNRGYYPDGTLDEIVGYATVVDQDEPAELNVQFPGVPDYTSGEPNYYVLDTDYSTYTLIASCTQLLGDLLNIQSVWILTRVPGLKPDNLDSLDDYLTSLGFDTNNFEITNQSDCPFDVKRPISS